MIVKATLCPNFTLSAAPCGSFGSWVIGYSSIRNETRETAMDTHRAAILTARTEPIQ